MFQATGLQNYHVNADVLLVFPNVDYNEGSGYNVTTGKFTAPVSGLYAFVKQICASKNDLAVTRFVRNGQNILTSQTNSPTIDAACASAQVFQYLSKGDQVWVKTSWDSYFVRDGSYRDFSFAGVFIRM